MFRSKRPVREMANSHASSGIAAALSASVADALPVSTPPNAIVYASGRVRITDMIRYGVLMDLIAVTVVPALVLLIATRFIG